MRTKVFKSGNSLAVRIPAEIAYPDNTEVEIARAGDVITIYPAAKMDLREAIELLRRLPKPDTVELIDRTMGRDTLDDLS